RCHSPRGCTPGELLAKPRLADPELAEGKVQSQATGASVLEPTFEDRELVFSADERIAHDSPVSIAALRLQSNEFVGDNAERERVRDAEPTHRISRRMPAQAAHDF